MRFCEDEPAVLTPPDSTDYSANRRISDIGVINFCKPRDPRARVVCVWTR